MEIYVLRHGEAEERETGLADRDRKLTAKGKIVFVHRFVPLDAKLEPTTREGPKKEHDGVYQEY